MDFIFNPLVKVKNKIKHPGFPDYPSHDSGHSKRKILPTLELLSPEDELEPRSDSRMSSSTDTDYSMGSRTPDDTRGEVHRLPSCGTDRCYVNYVIYGKDALACDIISVVNSMMPDKYKYPS